MSSPSHFDDTIYKYYDILLQFLKTCLISATFTGFSKCQGHLETSCRPIRFQFLLELYIILCIHVLISLTWCSAVFEDLEEIPSSLPNPCGKAEPYPCMTNHLELSSPPPWISTIKHTLISNPWVISYRLHTSPKMVDREPPILLLSYRRSETTQWVDPTLCILCVQAACFLTPFHWMFECVDYPLNYGSDWAVEL